MKLQPRPEIATVPKRGSQRPQPIGGRCHKEGGRLNAALPCSDRISIAGAADDPPYTVPMVQELR